MEENKAYLTEQIITYLGNKRSLLDFIGNAIKLIQSELGKDKLDIFDVFSGSGIVSRYFKKYANNLYVNDLEDYAYTINKCYLTNRSDIDYQELDKWYLYLKNNLIDSKLKDGFIREMYSPIDDNNIKDGERVFYTSRNARYIDTARTILDTIPEPYKTLFLGNLLYEASVKNNTSGVFKGFYKNSQTKRGQFGGNGRNALSRILADINIEKPVLSSFECNTYIYKGDSNVVCKNIDMVDVAYIDPPYNEHPYASNYFMLNLINNYKKPEATSRVSGIPKAWNRSDYNYPTTALEALKELCSNIKAKYLLISFNSEGFISYDEMVEMLSKLGDVKTFGHKYNTFKASRNLCNRDTYVTEFLFMVKKYEKV